jgi:hypothetical protein
MEISTVLKKPEPSLMMGKMSQAVGKKQARR